MHQPPGNPGLREIVETNEEPPLPDLGSLSIGQDSQESLLFSGYPTATNAPLHAGTATPILSHARQTAHIEPTPPAIGSVTVNVTVHSPAAPVTVNTATKHDSRPHRTSTLGDPSARSSARVSRPHTPSARSDGTTVVTPPIQAARGIRYIMRGGGKARVDWIPACESSATTT